MCCAIDFATIVFINIIKCIVFTTVLRMNSECVTSKPFKLSILRRISAVGKCCHA